MKNVTKREQSALYEKCSKNPVFFIANFLETIDNTNGGYVPFVLFDPQIRALKDFIKYQINLTIKYRQSGLSTLAAAYVVWMMVFGDPQKPETILIAGNKLDIAQNILKKIVDFYEQLPTWMVPYDFEKNKYKYVNKSTKYLELHNGTKIKAVACSTDALRGYTPTLLIIDEAAYIENGDEFWTAASPSLSTGGKAILISTPNGQDELYYKIYNSIKKGELNGNIIDLKWHEDPRYTKGLLWKKPIINEEDPENTFTDEMEEMVCWDKAMWDDLIKDGYEPWSPWFEAACGKLHNDERKINQELRGLFNGSGGNVFDAKLIDYYRKQVVKEPIRKEYDEGSIHIFAEPEVGHKYIIPCDVSRGDSEDYSSFQIIDATTMEQVVEFKFKVASEVLGALLVQYGSKYNQGMIIIDITGGYGDVASKTVQNFGYKNVFYTKWFTDPEFKPTEEDRPGLTFTTAVRVKAVDSLGSLLRNKELKIYSERFFLETDTFIYKNGRPDHTKGNNDDLIIAMAIGAVVILDFYHKLQALESKNKKMIDVFHNIIADANQVKKLKSVGGNPFIGFDTYTNAGGFRQTTISKEYASLFGIPKK